MRNYEAEKLKKIIQRKESAMIEQIKETDRLRNELKLHGFTDENMRDSFYAGKNYYDFDVWFDEFKSIFK